MIVVSPITTPVPHLFGQVGQRAVQRVADEVVDAFGGQVALARLATISRSTSLFTQSGAEGDLYLNVSGRHLVSIGGGHGRTFETLLKHCGLKPTQSCSGCSSRTSMICSTCRRRSTPTAAAAFAWRSTISAASTRTSTASGA
ncbi:MAG: hypothetical protein WAZ34_17220 [Rhodocyclaceae bacterium]